LEGHEGEKSVAGMISIPISSVLEIVLHAPISREYIPGILAPPPKVPHPIVSTSCIIGQTEVVVKGQFKRTLPNIGTPVHPPDVEILEISISTMREVILGLLIGQGSVGGAKL